MGDYEFLCSMYGLTGASGKFEIDEYKILKTCTVIFHLVI